MTRWLLVAALALGCGESSKPSSSRARVIDGTPTTAHRFVVAIGSKRTRCEDAFEVRCSGVLLAADAVLTAAHCFAEERPGVGFEVFVGDSVPAGDFVDVVDVAIHPLFDSTTRDDDLAILRLSMPLTGVAPATIGTSTVSAGALVEIVGFGQTNIEDPPDGIKRSGNATVEQITETAIVTGAGEAITCQGDSGGPLLAAGEVIGLASSGDAGCSENSIFARVAADDAFILGELAALPTSRPSGVDACEVECNEDTDCPAGLVCSSQLGGPDRCAPPGLNAGRFGERCSAAADCRSGICARTASDTCACLDPCEGAPTDPISSGGCSVSWYRH